MICSIYFGDPIDQCWFKTKHSVRRRTIWLSLPCKSKKMRPSICWQENSHSLAVGGRHTHHLSHQVTTDICSPASWALGNRSPFSFKTLPLESKLEVIMDVTLPQLHRLCSPPPTESSGEWVLNCFPQITVTYVFFARLDFLFYYLMESLIKYGFWIK